MNKVLCFLVFFTCFSGSIWAQTSSSSMNVDIDKDAKGNDEITFTLLVANSSGKAATNVEVALSLPPGLPDLIVQVMEKSIGQGTFSVDSRSTSEARVLKFKAKNANLARYNSNDNDTQGRIVIKTNLPFSRLEEVKATVKFDDMAPEAIEDKNVSSGKK